MAAPTPVTKATQTGHFYAVSFHGTWTDATNWADQILIDKSGLGSSYTNGIRITKLVLYCSPGVDCTLEFKDDSADEFIAKFPLGGTTPLVLDFTNDHPAGGFVYTGSGGSGDVVATTSNVASTDVVYGYIEAYVW